MEGWERGKERLREMEEGGRDEGRWKREGGRWKRDWKEGGRKECVEYGINEVVVSLFPVSYVIPYSYKFHKIE